MPHAGWTSPSRHKGQVTYVVSPFSIYTARGHFAHEVCFRLWSTHNLSGPDSCVYFLGFAGKWLLLSSPPTFWNVGPTFMLPTRGQSLTTKHKKINSVLHSFHDLMAFHIFQCSDYSHTLKNTYGGGAGVECHRTSDDLGLWSRSLGLGRVGSASYPVGY